MARKSGLGKGLDALIPLDEEVEAEGGLTQIGIDRIKPNPHQPRGKFDEEQLAELAASIREHGVIQPLIVTRGEAEGQYTLVAGERRWQAARQAGLAEVPVVLREASDHQLLELALVENLQRTDLNPLEAAEAYHQLNETFGLSHEQIAERVGKSRVAITNTLGLLDLSKAVQQALLDGGISEGHARALRALPSAQAQSAALKSVIDKGLSVRQTEELARKLKGVKPAKKAKPAPSPEIKRIEEQLRSALSTKVSVSHGAKGGQIIIHYYSDEELNALVERLAGEID